MSHTWLMRNMSNWSCGIKSQRSVDKPNIKPDIALFKYYMYVNLSDVDQSMVNLSGV